MYDIIHVESIRFWRINHIQVVKQSKMDGERFIRKYGVPGSKLVP